ncbi:hypothetical protein [Paracoccus jeotgali]|nr:hypothetical protein [Paracoccus jeotgali]
MAWHGWTRRGRAAILRPDALNESRKMRLIFSLSALLALAACNVPLVPFI